MSGTSRGNNDVFQYAATAYRMTGLDPSAADVAAAGLAVATLHPANPAAWTASNLSQAYDSRYRLIFMPRVVYPATVAVLEPWVGMPNAMAVSAAAAASLLVVVVGTFVLAVTGSYTGSLVAVIALFLTPLGSLLTLLMADAWVFPIWAAALSVASLYLMRGGGLRLVLFAILAILLAATKTPNLVALVLAVLACSVAFRAAGSAYGRRPLALATAVTGVFGGQVLVFAVLRLPGLEDTIQEFLTLHFTKPDVSNAIPVYLRLIYHRDRAYLSELIRSPAVWAPFVVGSVSLLRRSEPWRWLWLAGALATLAIAGAHPIRSEMQRWIAPAWISVAIGFGLAAAWLEQMARRRLAARTTDGLTAAG